jgi:carbamate kinase
VEPCVGVVTRAVVAADDPGLGTPTKAVGPILDAAPVGQPSRRTGAGWRLLVGSPRPVDVPELPALRALVAGHHVVAGGGGGVPVTAVGAPVQGVVDKDWLAALLAVELGADELVFVTDVEGVFEGFGGAGARLIRDLDGDAAARMLASDTLGAGSMAPKVESALTFAAARGRPARIAALGAMRAALQGGSGTAVHAGEGVSDAA